MLCIHSEICQNCPNIAKDVEQQISQKLEFVRTQILQNYAWSDVAISNLPMENSHFRQRADVVLLASQIGYYIMHPDQKKSVFQIKECPLWSRSLQSLFNEITKINWPIEKGSLRLRVNHKNEAGIWLDFANLDVKTLFEERKTLESLLKLGFVEIGQRRKKLVMNGEKFSLIDPVLYTWSLTWDGEKEVEMQTQVGAFTQSCDQAQILMSRWVDQRLTQSKVNTVNEFGSGQGTLTLAAAHQGRKVRAFEFDGLSAEAFKKNIESKNKNIELHVGDFQKESNLNAALMKADAYLLDPPRSGLKDFLNPLSKITDSEKPKVIISISCYWDSFIKDGHKLKEVGYKMNEISLLDQFPNTDHLEVLSLWTLCST